MHDDDPFLDDLVAFATANWGPVPRVAIATAQEVTLRLHHRGFRDAELAALKLEVLARAEGARRDGLAERAAELRGLRLTRWAEWRRVRRDGGSTRA